MCTLRELERGSLRADLACLCVKLEADICKRPSRLGRIQLKLSPDVTDCLIDVALVCTQCLECEVLSVHGCGQDWRSIALAGGGISTAVHVHMYVCVCVRMIEGRNGGKKARTRGTGTSAFTILQRSSRLFSILQALRASASQRERERERERERDSDQVSADDSKVIRSTGVPCASIPPGVAD